MIFKSGPVKAIFVEKDRLKADQPAVVVRIEGRKPQRFRRLILSGASVISQRDGQAWCYTSDEVEGVKGD